MRTPRGVARERVHRLETAVGLRIEVEIGVVIPKPDGEVVTVIEGDRTAVVALAADAMVMIFVQLLLGASDRVHLPPVETGTLAPSPPETVVGARAADRGHVIAGLDTRPLTELRTRHRAIDVTAAGRVTGIEDGRAVQRVECLA